MVLSRLKLRGQVSFILYFTSIVSLTSLSENFISNKIAFQASYLLNLPELMVKNELKKVSPKIIITVHFSAQFNTA